MNVRRVFSWIGFLTLTACSRNPTATAPAQSGAATGATIADPNDPFEGTAPPDQREKPPPPGLTPDWSFPTIVTETLDNGLGLRSVERHNLPIVELMLVVTSGSASDGDDPGLAVVAGELLKAGGAGKWSSRQLVDHAESLGSSIDVVTSRDATRISMGVLREHLDEALEVIAAVAMQPRFDYGEFLKLKRREMDRVESLARSDAGWAASMVLYRELYELPTAQHPYSRYDATAEQIEQINLADCRRWHREHFVPPNAVVVIAGDVTPGEVKGSAEKAFARWKGEAPPKVTSRRPMPPAKLELFLVDRPNSPQAQIFVATLGPERQSDEWASLRAANQILGGGVAGRLFLDVREKRSLAYRTGSRVEQVAVGPVPIVLNAGTQTAKAGLAVQALLQHFKKIAASEPTPTEVDIATRYLSDVFLLSVDTVGAIAGLTANLDVYGLARDYYDRYRAEVRNVTPEDVVTVARRYFRDGKAVVVVAGDAERLAKPLSHFGTVHVVDPDKEFTVKSQVAHNPSAPIELERIDGT